MKTFHKGVIILLFSMLSMPSFAAGNAVSAQAIAKQMDALCSPSMTMSQKSRCYFKAGDKQRLAKTKAVWYAVAHYKLSHGCKAKLKDKAAITHCSMQASRMYQQKLQCLRYTMSVEKWRQVQYKSNSLSRIKHARKMISKYQTLQRQQRCS